MIKKQRGVAPEEVGRTYAARKGKRLGFRAPTFGGAKKAVIETFETLGTILEGEICKKADKEDVACARTGYNEWFFIENAHGAVVGA